MRVIKEAFEFEWDKGNIGKNIKHKVEDKEAEEVFLDEGKVIYRDAVHSKNEDRFIIIGMTRNNRLLYGIFTYKQSLKTKFSAEAFKLVYRKKKIRIISARDINKKEVKLYEETT